MAFDWSKVEGYRDDMTDAEKIALLKDFSMPDHVAKSQFDKVASELSAAKKQLKERMTEEEQREAERQATDKALREELETLRRERALEKHKASFLAQKYSAEDAEEMAKALTDNDPDALFKALAKANVAAEKNLRAELMKGTPEPKSGGKESEASESDAVKLAKQLNEADTKAAKAAQDGISYYM